MAEKRTPSACVSKRPMTLRSPSARVTPTPTSARGSPSGSGCGSTSGTSGRSTPVKASPGGSGRSTPTKGVGTRVSSARGGSNPGGRNRGNPLPKDGTSERKIAVPQDEKSLRVEFIKAAKKCDYESLRAIVGEKSVDVNATFGSGYKAILQAAAAGNAQCVKLLIKSGANVNVYDFKHCTALMHSVVKGDMECTALLIEGNADANICDVAMESPLIKAVAAGNLECVKMLITAGADVNIGNNAGNTPLAFAAIFGRVECIRELVSAGADVNVKNCDNSTPLVLASRQMNLLRFDKGQKKIIHKRKGANSACVKALLESGAEVNVCTVLRQTPLYCAIKSNFTETVRLLLSANASIVHSEPNGVRYDSFEDRLNYFHQQGAESWVLFFAAGRKWHYYDSLKEVKKLKGKRMNLRNKCRETIRKALFPNIGNSNMFFLMEQLPLPTSLKSFLVYDLF